jgi:hypothetical protein
MPENVDSTRHDFSPAQLKMVTFYVNRLKEAEKDAAAARQQVSLFIGYVQEEASLPGKWSLAFDDEGNPFLQPAKKE